MPKRKRLEEPRCTPADPAKPPKGTPILSLPAEVHYRIASYRDLPDAFNLITVSRAFQDIGESIIWQDIVLSRFYLRALYDKASSDAEWELDSNGSGSEIRKKMERYDTSCDFRPSTIITAIASIPQRAQHVRALELPPTDIVAYDSQLELSILVATHLRSLRFRDNALFDDDPQLHLDHNYELCLESFQKMMSSIDGGFACLTRLDLSVHFDWPIHLPHILRQTPSISQLTIRFHEGLEDWYRVAEPYRSPRLKRVQAMWREGPSEYDLPSMPRLHHLSCQNITPLILPDLCLQLRTMPNLHTLEIDGVELDYSERDAAKDLKGLFSHPSIRRLDWRGDWETQRGLPTVMRTGEIVGLYELVINGGVYMESETYLENIQIPPSPTISTLLVACRTGEWCKSLKAPDWGKAPPPPRSIAASTIAELRLAPRLTSVHFTCGSRYEPDPSRLCHQRSNAVLIRSYTNGIDELFHLRRLELLKVDPKLYVEYDGESMNMCTGQDHRWVNHTFFDGLRVPDDVLDRVYKGLKEKKEWMTPGRDMELDEKGWKMLKAGRKRAAKMRDMW